ncbi:hypothetical protein CSOJ01_03003 [Colletotrichum sojae]|uniref:Uncharacterized protein n=1 Tax=Colletotrichum sojae TaxID=2175907 RepID=A0A8H6N1X0_9PEZI|nr:hypothetical protein CSOJ01_03003 [Colletotrichum sojae]
MTLDNNNDDAAGRHRSSSREKSPTVTTVGKDMVERGCLQLPPGLMRPSLSCGPEMIRLLILAIFSALKASDSKSDLVLHETRAQRILARNPDEVAKSSDGDRGGDQKEAYSRSHNPSETPFCRSKAVNYYAITITTYSREQAFCWI